MALQMLIVWLFASRTGFESWIDCMLEQAALGRMIFRMKLAPVPALYTDANRAVDRRSNSMLA